MHIIDILEIFGYFLFIIFIGFYFYRKNKSTEDYYVGGRSLSSMHIGLSVVATDVGGGFSIGLGGLGFVMGLSGSWMLFTGLIGAWLSAVVLIPVIFKIPVFKNLLTFPQIFEHFFDKKVALAAGIISAVGYLGFTSSQVLAGAKLASVIIPELNIKEILVIMGLIIVLYTSFGGMKAVVYTDTIQWIVLMVGLIFIGIPLTYYQLGGYEKIVSSLPSEFFSLSNISAIQLINWGITIIPIWFVGMTLYQRIFSSKDLKSAKKAWFIAGLFEWPIMAFLGVGLGLFARIGVEQGLFANIGIVDATSIDPEQGLPLLLKSIFPVGLLGIMISAYFSAIMSTADSCLMAASGNVLTDIVQSLKKEQITDKQLLKYSQIITFLLGGLAILIATYMQNVLSLMLYSYAFMVSGLFFPIIVALFFKKKNSQAAFWSVLSGGLTTLILIITEVDLQFGFDANLFGIGVSVISYFSISFFTNKLANSAKTHS